MNQMSLLLSLISFLIDHQPIHLRYSVAAGQYLPQKVGRQEVAQHGQSKLHQEELQTMAGRQEYAGYCQKGTEVQTHKPVQFSPYRLRKRWSTAASIRPFCICWYTEAHEEETDRVLDYFDLHVALAVQHFICYEILSAIFNWG